MTGRIQLLAGIVLAAILPTSIRLLWLGDFTGDPQALNTGCVIALSIMVGFWLLRRVNTLPGVQTGAGVISSFGIAFAGVMLAILVLRIDYTRSLLLLGFVITLAWFYLVHAFTRRHEWLSIGLVAGGDVDQLAELPRVRSRVLRLDEAPTGIDAVAADFRHLHEEVWEARIADYALAGLPVYHAKDLHESLSGKSNLQHLSENNLGGLRPLDSYMQIKAIFDVLLALPALLVLTPLFIVAAVAIKLDSPGPILFRQHRIGLGGRPFRVFKFRTMRVINPGGDNVAARHEFVTRSNDDRVTKAGRFLRRTRIDELPQIINIMRGEMSWIGPRPEALALAQWYEAELPFYRYRHIVRPGITGWAQINQGHVAAIEEIRTKLQYDFFYIRNFSAWLDLVILIRTVRTVVTGFGHK